MLPRNALICKTLIVSCLLSTALSAGGIQLRFQPKPGSEFQVRQEIKQDAQVDLGPLGAQKFDNTIVIESSQKTFMGDAASSSRIKHVMNRLRMDVRQGETVLVEFDSSDQSGESGMQENVAPLLGKPLTIHLSKLGEVLSISGYAEMLSSLPDIDDPKIRESLKTGLSEESVAQMMQMSLPTFPEGELAEGNSWTHDSQFANPLFGTMNITSTYTVKGLDKCSQEECVRLDVAMDQSLELDAGIFEQLKAASGISPDIRIDDIQGSGTLWIATTDGVTLKSEIQQQISLTMKISSEGQTAIEMHMAADQKIHQVSQRQ